MPTATDTQAETCDPATDYIHLSELTLRADLLQLRTIASESEKNARHTREVVDSMIATLDRMKVLRENAWLFDNAD